MILVDKTTKSLENGEFVTGILLDFSKAFDTVNHDILLQKLHHYGIQDTALMWFKSYLGCHYQYVTYNSTESSNKVIKCGVPQGSILGPLLFLVYIIDLANVCKYSMPLLFADDTNLFYCGKDPRTIEYMIITTKNYTRSNLNVQIEGHIIDETCQSKFLVLSLTAILPGNSISSIFQGRLQRELV